jgi:hypothetical protein
VVASEQSAVEAAARRYARFLDRTIRIS